MFLSLFWFLICSMQMMLMKHMCYIHLAGCMLNMEKQTRGRDPVVREGER